MLNSHKSIFKLAFRKKDRYKCRMFEMFSYGQSGIYTAEK